MLEETCKNTKSFFFWRMKNELKLREETVYIFVSQFVKISLLFWFFLKKIWNSGNFLFSRNPKTVMIPMENTFSVILLMQSLSYNKEVLSLNIESDSKTASKILKRRRLSWRFEKPLPFKECLYKKNSFFCIFKRLIAKKISRIFSIWETDNYGSVPSFFDISTICKNTIVVEHQGLRKK